jgi:hypothetical protein
MTDAEAAFDSLSLLRGVRILYSRAGESVDLVAIPGRTEFEEAGAIDGAVTFTSRDYLVKRSDLLLAGLSVKPAKLDTITEGDTTYEVRAPGTARVYRPHSPDQSVLRIHAFEKAT